MDKSVMDPSYNPETVEDRQYRLWLEKDSFVARGEGPGEPFTIVIPPPNVTGSLHMGHALNCTIQDIIIRWRRMQGDDTLWLPGTDHAGIATQIRVEEDLAKEGMTRHELGREPFLEKVWEWKETYHARITEQLQRLGVSCDWSRERFTMDEGCSQAVRKVFVDLYRQGLIYRGDYLINWCPRCRTALSDIEVEHEERPSTLTFIRYPLVGEEGSITVATTRPETMLGDTAVAVNPEDERYRHLVGKRVLLPLMEREIPVVADSYVDPTFGTGAVKITPGHDPNDFEIGQRHGLEAIQVIGKDGKMTGDAGRFTGLEVGECRRQVVEELKALGLVEKIDEYSHAVGQCQRCATDIEPLVSRQWFVKMKPLSTPAIAAVKEGRVKFVPERFAKTYLNWVENVRDWCISRQIWWGHRIPAWYCSCGETIVDYNEPIVCPACGGRELVQDPDVLDTWFSSALWPFSTLGWPEETPDLRRFFPTSVLVTGYDIIYFWVARMIFMSLEFLDEVPFHTVYINGLVRDSLGRKMSKSLGNGIDPLEVIADYGADTLRFTLITGQAPGHDQRFRQENVEAGRNFSNKIWNASRFVLMNLCPDGGEGGKGPDLTGVLAIKSRELPSDLNRADRWILNRYNETVQGVTTSLQEYELGEAARLVYEFLWNDYCDWYLELSKYYLYAREGGEAAERDRRRTRGVLLFVLEGVLRLLHPFMPFISEEIWQHLPGRFSREPLVVSPWPRPCRELNFPRESTEMAMVQKVIRAIRNLRSQVQLPPTRRSPVVLRATAELEGVLRQESHQLARLALAEPLTFDPSASKPRQALTAVVSREVEAYLPLKGVIDLEAEVGRLQRELQQMEGDLERTKGKLANRGFLQKAPAEIVEKEQARYRELNSRQEKLKQRIRELT
ncbi:MAG: valine--tRNA ligase [Firmicutes bacterium]|nr:valine--tRNA ligase [Bacillota bacterium]